MKYILENSSLKYLLEEFPQSVMPEIWNEFEIGCNEGNIVSEKETKKLLEMELANVESLDWVEKNKSIFKSINEKEASELGNMIKEGIFGYYENSSRLTERRLPEGIPFIISIAKCQKYVIVYRKNGKDMNKILSICKEKNIKCIEVEQLLIDLKESSEIK